MKKTIVLVALFSIFMANAQEPQQLKNFVLNDNILVWQRIFQTSKTATELFNYFIESQKVENYDLSDNRLSGYTQVMKNNYKLAGYGIMSTPMYLSCFDTKATVLIEYKENRYRVTLSNIKLLNNGSNPAFSTDQTNDLEAWALGKKGFSRQFSKSSVEIIDTTLIEYFTIKDISKSDW